VMMMVMLTELDRNLSQPCPLRPRRLSQPRIIRIQ
jgi:hypothetical protein